MLPSLILQELSIRLNFSVCDVSMSHLIRWQLPRTLLVVIYRRVYGSLFPKDAIPYMEMGMQMKLLSLLFIIISKQIVSK